MICFVHPAAGPQDWDGDLADPEARDGCSLEKAWQGLHHLLTGEGAGGAGPLGLLVAGGTPIPGSDRGVGPGRSLDAAATLAVHDALIALDDAHVWSRFDAAEITRLAIYPRIWDEPADELRDEYLFYLGELRRVVATAAARGDGLIVEIA